MLKLNFEVGELFLLERTLALMFEKGFSDDNLEEKVVGFIGDLYKSRGIENVPEDPDEYRNRALDRLLEYIFSSPQGQLADNLSRILNGTKEYGLILEQA